MPLDPTNDRWRQIEEKLGHAAIQSNLIRASLSLAAWEILKSCVLRAPEDAVMRSTEEDMAGYFTSFKDVSPIEELSRE